MFCQKKEPPEFCEFAQKSSLFFAASKQKIIANRRL